MSGWNALNAALIDGQVGTVSLTRQFEAFWTAEQSANVGALPPCRIHSQPNDAAAFAIASGLLERRRTALILRESEFACALTSLADIAQLSLLRSGVVLFSIGDSPESLPIGSDIRQLLSSTALLPILEPGDSAELYALTRYALELSEAIRSPVVVRMSNELICEPTPFERTEKDPAPRGAPRFLIPGAPIATIAALSEANRAFRFAALEAAFESLSGLTALDLPTGADRGALISGGVGRFAASQARARGLASLRLGVAYPPLISAIVSFAARHKEVLVIEANQTYLAPWAIYLQQQTAAAENPDAQQTTFLHCVLPPGGTPEIALDDLAMLRVTGLRHEGAAAPLDVAAALRSLRGDLTLEQQASPDLGAQPQDDQPWRDAFYACRNSFSEFDEKSVRDARVRKELSRIRIEAARAMRHMVVVTSDFALAEKAVSAGLCDIAVTQASAVAIGSALAAAESVGENPGRPVVAALLTADRLLSEIVAIADVERSAKSGAPADLLLLIFSDTPIQTTALLNALEIPNTQVGTQDPQLESPALLHIFTMSGQRALVLSLGPC